VVNQLREQQRLLKHKHEEIMDLYFPTMSAKKRKEISWLLDVGLTEGFSLGVIHALNGNIRAMRKLKEYRRDDQAPTDPRE
jgi:hypothetical protein